MLSECVFVRMLQRVQYEDELLQAKRTAEAARDAKAKFLSMMSHELRTPLQAISGYCDLLLQETSGPITRRTTGDLNAVQNASCRSDSPAQRYPRFCAGWRPERATLETERRAGGRGARSGGGARPVPKLAEAGLRYRATRLR